MPCRLARLAYRRVRKQKQREEILLTYGSPGPDYSLDVPGLPLPGRPWWRVARRKLGLPVPELPFESPYARVPASLIADRRKAKRDGDFPYERHAIF